MSIYKRYITFVPIIRHWCILHTPWKVLADDQTPDSNVVYTITFAIILDNVYDSLGFVVLNPQGKTPGRFFWDMKFVVILLGAIKHQLYEKTQSTCQSTVDGLNID